MKKKFISVLLALSLALGCMLSLAACGGGRGSAFNREGDIVIWTGGQWVGDDFERLEDFFDDYNASEAAATYGKVKLETRASLEIEFTTSLLSNDQPDLLIWDRYSTSSSAHADNFLSVDDFVETDGTDLTVFNQAALGEMKYDGKLFGLPIDVDVWGLFVNKKKLGIADKTAPATWTELLDVAKALTTYTAGTENVASAGFATSDLYGKYFTFLTSAGATPIKDDAANFDNAETRAFMQFIRDMQAKKVDRSGYNTKENFKNGDLGMIYGSSYLKQYLVKYASKLDWEFVPQPKCDYPGITGGVNAGLLGGFGFTIPKPTDASNRNDAWQARSKKVWELISFLTTSEEFMQKWTKTCGALSALRSTWTSEIVTEDPYFSVAASIADSCKARPSGYYFVLTEQQAIVPQFQAFQNKSSTTVDAGIAALVKATNDYINTIMG